MPNLKDIKNRIGSVKKTKQITSAMKLVAAARLKRATDSALAARPYREQLGSVLQRVATAAGDEVDEPLLRAHENVRTLQVVVLTSDRGLCGPFNNALLRRTQDWLEEKRAAGFDPRVRVYGRKGSTFLRRAGWTIDDAVLNWTKMDKMELVRPLTAAMVGGFVDGEHDETWLVYNRFVNTLVQKPTFERILPLSVEAGEGGGGEGEAGLPSDYRYEPASTEILGVLLPLYLRTLVLQTFLETEAGFYAAQMTAMDNATRNASDLIERLSLDYNRARQAAITTEIIEIVSGAAAL